jgi:hypothetical protein
MKRMIAIGLFLNGALLAGVVLKDEVVVHAVGGGAGVPIGNGEVNGDGRIDISDAVYTLSWLFTGGPEPVAIECQPPAAKGLPVTGQTNCFDSSGVEIPCDSATCPGQDGAHVTGCPSEGPFIAPMWQKETADISGDGLLDGNDRVSWCDALAYCEGLTFAKHDDWRLPNIRELRSLIDFGPGLSRTIDPVFGAFSGFYWSSTSVADAPHYAWNVYFNVGFVGIDYKDLNLFYVRAVRNAP